MSSKIQSQIDFFKLITNQFADKSPSMFNPKKTDGVFFYKVPGNCQ